MKKTLLAILILLFSTISSGCQGFLDEYSYNPMGASSPGSY